MKEMLGALSQAGSTTLWCVLSRKIIRSPRRFIKWIGGQRLIKSMVVNDITIDKVVTTLSLNSTGEQLLAVDLLKHQPVIFARRIISGSHNNTIPRSSRHHQLPHTL